MLRKEKLLSKEDFQILLHQHKKVYMFNKFRKDIAGIISPSPVRTGTLRNNAAYLRARQINHQPVITRSLKPKSTSGSKQFTMNQLTRLTNDWVRTAQSVNFDLYSGLTVMRARGKDMLMNDPIAKKFIKLIKKNVIGPNGFILKVKSYDWIKQQDGTTQKVFDKFANRFIQDKFTTWMKKNNCNFVQDSSFREMCNLAMSTVASQGEMFIQILKGKEYGPFGYMLNVVDPSMIDERYNKRLPGGNYIQMGIEYDQYGRVVNYHIRTENPANDIYSGGYFISTDYKPISAENMLHLFVKEFPDQKRGISWFAPAALRMHMLNKASEAAVINFRIGASKTLVLKQTEQFNPSIEEAEDQDPYGNVLENVEPGETYKIPFGYEPWDYNPQYPNNEFSQFTDSLVLQIASGFDVSHPSLSSNYKGTTWTSSRTALIDERDGWREIQNWFKENFLDDIYSSWLKMFLLSQISNPLPPTKFEKFNQPIWYGRTWEWVDPEKEENARIKQFKYHFKTFGEIIGQDGKDLEEHLQEIQDEENLFEQYDIEFPDDIPDDMGIPNETAAGENNSGNNNQNNNANKIYKNNGSVIHEN